MSERVVGTPVEVAGDDDRARTVLVSDLHVPSDGGAVLEAFEALLDDAARTASTRVFVLGDLFDAYTGPKQARVGVWRRTAEAIARTVAAGTPVTLLHGNRDFMLDGAFESLSGCRVVAGGVRLRLGAARALLLHGDELCQRDLPYQKAKRRLRHPATRTILRNLPLRVALHLAERARRQSSKVMASGDQTRFDPTLEAMREVFRGDTDLLVFGHIHRPARGPFPGGEYAILPAFDEDAIHLVHADGSLAYHRVGGGRVADYPPREFC